MGDQSRALLPPADPPPRAAGTHLGARHRFRRQLVRHRVAGRAAHHLADRLLGRELHPRRPHRNHRPPVAAYGATAQPAVPLGARARCAGARAGRRRVRCRLHRSAGAAGRAAHRQRAGSPMAVHQPRPGAGPLPATHSRHAARTAGTIVHRRATGLSFPVAGAPRAAQRLLERVRPPREAPSVVHSGWNHGPMLTRAVGGVLDADARLGLAAARRRLPFAGLSVWAVCRREHE